MASSQIFRRCLAGAERSSARLRFGGIVAEAWRAFKQDPAKGCYARPRRIEQILQIEAIVAPAF
jgi:hypothetical protein